MVGVTLRTIAMTASSVVPFSKARVAAPWITGPSAKGSCKAMKKDGSPISSLWIVPVHPCHGTGQVQLPCGLTEYGTPSSMTLAPMASRRCKALAVVSKSGSPATRKGIKAILRR